jgi:hypothetical protein
MADGKITPERADAAIFAGEFDHWGSVTVRSGPVVECGIDDCDYLERVDFGSRQSEHVQERIGAFAFQLHLSHSHLDDVINALEDRA